MIVVLMLGALLAAIGYYAFVVPPATPVARDAPNAEVVAAAMLIYQKAAVDWCLRTSCLPTGGAAVPAGELYLPAGYTALAMPWLAAVADGSSVSTFVAGLTISPTSVALSLGDLTGGGPSAGWTDHGLKISTRGYFAGQPQVSAIPPIDSLGQLVPVVSQRVR